MSFDFEDISSSYVIYSRLLITMPASLTQWEVGDHWTIRSVNPSQYFSSSLAKRKERRASGPRWPPWPPKEVEVECRESMPRRQRRRICLLSPTGTTDYRIRQVNHQRSTSQLQPFNSKPTQSSLTIFLVTPQTLKHESETMPPANPRKRKSSEMEEEPVPAATPTGSPRKKMRITQSQKQALMDNLQLESERKTASGLHCIA